MVGFLVLNWPRVVMVEVVCGKGELRKMLYCRVYEQFRDHEAIVEGLEVMAIGD